MPQSLPWPFHPPQHGREGRSGLTRVAALALVLQGQLSSSWMLFSGKHSALLTWMLRFRPTRLPELSSSEGLLEGGLLLWRGAHTFLSSFPLHRLLPGSPEFNCFPPPGSCIILCLLGASGPRTKLWTKINLFFKLRVSQQWEAWLIHRVTYKFVNQVSYPLSYC